VRVGLMLPMGDETGPGVPASYAEIKDLAVAAEQAGLDSLWVYDHLLMVEGNGPPTGTWEAWTLLAALASATQTAQLGVLVSCTSFRHPGLLAKMADTVAEISGDRLILGLGAGWHEPEYRAFGLPFDHRVGRFSEALEITATMLREGAATLEGRYYSVRDCPLLPARDERNVPILIGSGGGDRMLGLVAQWADAWNTAWYATPNDRFFGIRERLHAACEKKNRDPSTVDVTVGMMVGDGERRVPRTAEAIAEALSAWRDQDVRHVICWPDPTDRAGADILFEGARLFRAAA
jgi:alkanesulfonate monooxygenase SsuD/methylene tetrahydromethanopterin reductase-like flavin-dependent oxidoreductase (luciferase family)